MYATKDECRKCLLCYKKYIKLSVLAKEFNISTTNLSMFMKGSEFDYYFGLAKLNDFINYIQKHLMDNVL